MYIYTYVAVSILSSASEPAPMKLFPLGPTGLGPCGPPWVLMGRALMAPPGPLWTRPLWAVPGSYGPGPYGPTWALVARPL